MAGVHRLPGGQDAGLAAGAVRPGGAVADREPGAAAGDHDAVAAGRRGAADRAGRDQRRRWRTRPPPHMRRELVATLAVPDGKKVSALEWMRTPVTRLSGTGMCEALDRSAYVLGLGTRGGGLPRGGAGEAGRAGPVRDDRQGPEDQAAGGHRRAATLLATVRHLEGVSVDDALLLFDLLMSTKLLSQASRAADKEKLRNLPRLRVAAAGWRPRGRSCGTPRRRRSGRTARRRTTTAAEVVDAVVQVVSREQLEAALETVAELLPLPSSRGRRRPGVAGGAGRPVRHGEAVHRAAGVGGPVGIDRGRLAGRRGGEGAAPGDGGPQAGRRAHQGVRGPGDGVVAAAGVRQPQAGPAADRQACLRLLRPGGPALGAAAPRRVRGRRGQVGQPAGPPDRGAAVGARAGTRADRAGPGGRPRALTCGSWPRPRGRRLHAGRRGAGGESVGEDQGRQAARCRGWRPRRCPRGSRPSTTRCRRCCPASTTRSCCWRCRPGPACSTHSSTSPGRTAP